MSTINFTPIPDGTTIDGADVNTPLTTIYNEFNGNIDNSNIKANAAIDGSKLADSSVANNKLTVNPETVRSETSFDHVASGCVWSGDSYGSTRNASMTSGVVYINGIRVAVTAVTARTFTASRDTYIDVGTDGVVDYNEVTNNAASPALSASHIRLGIIVTDATDIQDAGSVNQGQENKVLPIASSVPYAVTDSLGNLICPRDPNRKLLGLRQITSTFTGSGFASQQVTGLSCPVIVPTGRKVRVSLYSPSWGGTSFSNPAIWDGVVNSGIQVGSIQVVANSGGTALYEGTPSSLSKTYNAGTSSTSGTTTCAAGATFPAYIRVELV